MVQFNMARRELTIKIVYYGPALSGKTTNIQSIHGMIDDGARGRLMTLDTQDDRTLFFDLLPVQFKTQSGFKIKLKVYTVPGQVIHNSTRKLVLAGADAVAFIADSQRHLADANTQSWNNMIQNLKENNLNPDEIPVAIQFNKRDLDKIRTDDEISQLRTRSPEPIYTAIATEGKGVFQTFFGLLSMTYDALDRKHNIQQKLGLVKQDFLGNVYKNIDGVSLGLTLSDLLDKPGFIHPDKQ